MSAMSLNFVYNLCNTITEEFIIKGREDMFITTKYNNRDDGDTLTKGERQIIVYTIMDLLFLLWRS